MKTSEYIKENARLMAYIESDEKEPQAKIEHLISAILNFLDEEFGDCKF